MGRAAPGIPKGEFWVIADRGNVGRVVLDCIQEPAAADGVAGLRNSNALIERPYARKGAREGKIADYPPISLMIVKRKTVALILAQPARRGSHREEQSVVGRAVGAIERVTIFIKNLDGAIDRLHIMIRTDIAIRIGRQTATPTLA